MTMFHRPSFDRIVIGVDPSVTCHEDSDECGIVVVGKKENEAYVLEDASCRASPSVWAQCVMTLYHRYEADCVVVEVNMGGDLVETVLRAHDALLPIKTVRARAGKYARAEPIAALYAQGRVYHASCFEVLENQMCTFGGPDHKGASPDRMDALVWALWELMLTRQTTTQISWL